MSHMSHMSQMSQMCPMCPMRPMCPPVRKRVAVCRGGRVAADAAVEAAKELGGGTRVVSMPCMERFDRQSDDYRAEVLPKDCKRRVAIEAGVSGLWWKYVGDEGTVLGIDRFGISAPGNTAMKELGMTSEDVVAAAASGTSTLVCTAQGRAYWFGQLDDEDGIVIIKSKMPRLLGGLEQVGVELLGRLHTLFAPTMSLSSSSPVSTPTPAITSK